jgi:hypothetical protein
MVWNGNYWRHDGALAVAQKIFEDSSRTPSDYIEFASEVYAAAGAAFAEAKISVKKHHYGRSTWWLMRALRHGNQALCLVDVAWGDRDVALYGLDHDAMDISCAVWRNCGWLRHRGRIEEVKWVLRRLMWDEFLSDSYRDCPSHTKAFLFSHAVWSGIYSLVPENIVHLEKWAEYAHADGFVAQASRVWRHAGDFWRELGSEYADEYQYAFTCAKALAESSSSDQLKKLQ